MTKSQKIWLAAGGGVAALIALALWRAGIACSTPRIRSPLKIGEAAGCYEFWINRYQSLISAAIAAIVALLVVRPVIGQLGLLIKQTKAQQSTAIAAIAAAFEAEERLILDLVMRLRAFRQQMPKDTPEEAMAYPQMSYITGLETPLEQAIDRMLSTIKFHRTDAELTKAREAALQCCQEFLRLHRDALHRLPTITASPQAMTFDELQSLKAKAKETIDAAVDRFHDLSRILSARIAADSERANRLAREATDP